MTILVHVKKYQILSKSENAIYFTKFLIIVKKLSNYDWDYFLNDILYERIYMLFKGL